MYKTSLLTIAIGVCMLSTPFLAGAQTVTTTSNVQTEIQILLTRIQDLQGKVAALLSASGSGGATSGAIAVPTCYPFSRALAVGARGSDVSALQQFLIARGHSIPAGATGYFGAQTKLALANWQMTNNVALSTDSGSGIFGPISRGAFSRWCSSGGVATSTPATFSFAADPQSGEAPLEVTFTASAPISSGSSTFSVDFGDKSDIAPMTEGSCIAITAIVGGQGGIRCSYTVPHTYAAAGTYTARLVHDTCPAGAQCFVGPMTVATKTVTVTAHATTVKDVTKLTAPGSVTLALGGIAEVRNVSSYFTLTGLTATSATIEVTPVGCWNYYPSDTPPQIMCMIYVMPIPPQTLTVGQSYQSGKSDITLTKIENNKATFSVRILSTL
jgi:peptidoglycan hydrolase-like protein with peptidoglycan-binding domain